ncbi:accessory gene regulator ArgB-like protein [Candidatus Clostridium stratigraminis]|uniref:Accessory gene regulator ArgB-like protein n=1 Tax=Candidatus Clostridium stratigraminis TaxID=3381661 RepID=A0ABW8T5C3_9CLOT
MERLTNNIAAKISEELKLDNDKRDVIAYGMFAIIDIAFSIFLVIIFGLFFHVTIEALIVCLTGSILRKYSGGAHAASPGKCAAITTIVCIGLALFLKLLIANIITPSVLYILGIVIYVISYYLIYKLAPVDSPSKPIKKKEKKDRMKKGSSLVLSIYTILVIASLGIYFYTKNKSFLVYSSCVYGGTMWQAFTLTKAGHSTVHNMDKFLSRIFAYKKRR